MTSSLEDRLRAHFADRTAREELPGRDTDEALAETLARAEMRPTTHHPRWNNGQRPQFWLAVAAVLVVVAGVAAVVLAGQGDDTSPLSTDEDPDEQPAPTTEPPTTVPDSTATPSSTTVAPASDTGPTIIVSADGVIGGWDGSRWVAADAVDAVAGDEYQIVRLGDAITTATATTRTWSCDAGPEVETIDVGLRYTDDALGPNAIAVTGVANPRPRLVEVLDPATPEYQEAAVAVLADLGIDDPDPEVVQVVRTDIDGDGTAEVFVTTELMANGTVYSVEGDYSVTFIRRIVGGSVQTTVVADSVSRFEGSILTSITASRISAVADLNGDSRPEVVFDTGGWEQSGTIVNEVGSDGTLTEVLRRDCGV